MREKLRWLAVPPALALLLMFGPWRSEGAPQSSSPASTRATPETAPARATPKTTPAAFPNLSQVLCTVFGVCLLGGAVVVALARVRQRQNTGAGAIVQLRQSVRLSGRHAVHAVQFDDKIFLLGECEGSLAVLHAGTDRELIAPPPTAPEPDDDGAILKDMKDVVLPRPARAPSRAVPDRAHASFRALLRKTHVGA
jgi:hypothetical protein